MLGKLSAVGCLMLGLAFSGMPTAQAGQPPHYHHGGHSHDGYGIPRGYGPPRGTHLDYHPGSFVPHRGHYDYVPGHYDVHRHGHGRW
jgi:hypothetical protein